MALEIVWAYACVLGQFILVRRFFFFAGEMMMYSTWQSHSKWILCIKYCIMQLFSSSGFEAKRCPLVIRWSPYTLQGRICMYTVHKHMHIKCVPSCDWFIYIYSKLFALLILYLILYFIIHYREHSVSPICSKLICFQLWGYSQNSMIGPKRWDGRLQDRPAFARITDHQIFVWGKCEALTRSMNDLSLIKDVKPLDVF